MLEGILVGIVTIAIGIPLVMVGVYFIIIMYKEIKKELGYDC